MAELTVLYKAPSGAPLTAPTDAPEIQIRRVDTQAVVQAFTAMTEIGDGVFSFAFVPTVSLDYAFTCDGDPNVTGQVQAAERFQGGSFPGTIDLDSNLSNLDVAVSTRSVLAQADILSDATPFAGGNVDAAISSRATQAQILSDATPFPGANIDATISSRATQASVDAIQNNTRFQGIVPEITKLPASGSVTYRWFGRLFDTNGSPEDPDSNTMNIRVEDSAGGIVVATTPMTRTGVGLYQYDYVVNSTDTERQLVVFFEYDENAVAFQQVRVTVVTEFESKLDIIQNAVVNDIPADIAALNDLSQADVQAALTAQGYTAPRAPLLDNLDALISSRTDIADVQTALDNQGYTIARASNLDNLDAAISSLVGQGLTAAQSAQLIELWRIFGLDSTTPLQVRITPSGLFVEPVGGGAAVIQIDYSGDGVTSSTGVRSV